MFLDNEYVKYIQNPYAFCNGSFCDLYGLKFYRISVSPLQVSLYNDCIHCGATKTERFKYEDMFHHFKMFMEGNEIGSVFTRFKMGLYYPDKLFETEPELKKYNELFLKMFKRMRRTVLTIQGKKVKIKDLGFNVENYLTR